MTFIRSVGTERDPEQDDSGSLLFPAATGKGVRVAVVDSGVHRQHPHIQGVTGGVSVGPDGEVAAGVYSDQLGHGTAVMAAIQEKAPGADYYAVKVFHESLRTTADALLSAIEWCVAERIDVINLSLGTVNPAHAERFGRAVEKANAAGSLLVAAREAEGTPCWPGCLAGVFSVALDWDCPRNTCRCEETVFYASGYPRPAPGVPRRRNLHGISFVVANMTGFVARACEVQDQHESPAARMALVRDILIRECAAL